MEKSVSVKENPVTTRQIEGIEMVTFEDIPEAELANYVAGAKSKHPNPIKRMTIVLDEDGEHVKVFTEFHARPFERIRRITGYLSRLDGFATLSSTRNKTAPSMSQKARHRLSLNRSWQTLNSPLSPRTTPWYGLRMNC